MADPDSQSMAVAIGEIRGQLKELIHTSNNNSHLLNGLTERVLLAANLPDRLSALEAEQKRMSAALDGLSADKNRRDGASGIISTLAKSPALGWIAGVAIAAYAAISGKVDL